VPEVGHATGGEDAHPSAQVDTSTFGERPHRLGIALALDEDERVATARLPEGTASV
jgi:hypothetical protein